jgi:hypothetical protein
MKDLGVLYVEMEAAGLMDEFSCLVIRGICDYAEMGHTCTINICPCRSLHVLEQHQFSRCSHQFQNSSHDLEQL